MTPLCIYHGNCADGFGAAWVVRKALDAEVEFHAGVYQNEPPDVTGRDVYIVDFSYKQVLLAEMGHKARSITIIDHHKTAADDLASYTHEKTFYGVKGAAEVMAMAPSQFADYCGMLGVVPVRALFDLNRSGAGLAWDYFFPNQPRPTLIDHIEDRDLWKFALPGTREIQANVFSYPYDFEVWDELMARPPHELIAEGRAIERKHFKDIEELTKVVTRQFTIGGHSVPVANLPYTLTSDAGHLLAKGKPFAGCYWDTPAGRVFSLRSTEEGFDVAEIAKQYGGGGHKHASGFRVPFGHELAR